MEDGEKGWALCKMSVSSVFRDRVTYGQHSPHICKPTPSNVEEGPYN